MNENASLSLGSMVMNFMWSSLVACKILQHWPLGYAHLGYHSKHCSYDCIFAIKVHLISYAQRGQCHMSGHMGVVNACDKPTWGFSFLVKAWPSRMTCLRRQLPNNSLEKKAKGWMSLMSQRTLSYVYPDGCLMLWIHVKGSWSTVGNS